MELLEPLGEMVFGVKVVNDSAQPGKNEQKDDGNNLPDNRNRFLQNVDGSDDTKNLANEDDKAHHRDKC